MPRNAKPGKRHARKLAKAPTHPVAHDGVTDLLRDGDAEANVGRIVAARIRLQAARTRVLSAEELAQASARMAEGAFMDFTIREIE